VNDEAGAHQPQWHTSHFKINNKKLKKLYVAILGEMTHLNVMPSSTYEYSDTSEGLSIKDNTYYLPKSTIQVRLDSFIVINHHLFIFRFTVGQDHPIKYGLIPFLEKCHGLPP